MSMTMQLLSIVTIDTTIISPIRIATIIIEENQPSTPSISIIFDMIVDHSIITKQEIKNKFKNKKQQQLQQANSNNKSDCE